MMMAMLTPPATPCRRSRVRRYGRLCRRVSSRSPMDNNFPYIYISKRMKKRRVWFFATSCQLQATSSQHKIAHTDGANMASPAFLSFPSSRSYDAIHLSTPTSSQRLQGQQQRPEAAPTFPPRMTSDDESAIDWVEPTLEQSLNAIDDAYFERHPGGGMVDLPHCLWKTQFILLCPQLRDPHR